jgi:DNA-binding CsgD family transcriptional regulator
MAPAGLSSVPLAPKASTYPAGLTAREVEVLRLVAQGFSEAQVAEQLAISPRTVNWHLTSIYSKLQVSSRAAASRFAIEQHLVYCGVQAGAQLRASSTVLFHSTLDLPPTGFKNLVLLSIICIDPYPKTGGHS